MEFSPSQRALLLDVARATIRRALAGEDPPADESGPPVLPPAGAAAIDGLLVVVPPASGVPSFPGSGPVHAAHLPPDPLADPILHQAAGCFVTLHALHTRRLRGCVGRLDATMPLLRTLRSTAVSVLDDPRFRHCPVCLDELCRLELEISVVSPLSPAGHPLDFEPVRHGIYLTIGRRSGCFLPQVAQETGWGHEQLLDRLCTEKMGLAASAWRNGEACLSVFTTVTIGPEPFIPTGSM